jgi:hypothetical protein
LRRLSRIFAALAVLCFALALMTSIVEGSICFGRFNGFRYLDIHMTPRDNGGTLILYDY